MNQRKAMPFALLGLVAALLTIVATTSTATNAATPSTKIASTAKVPPIPAPSVGYTKVLTKVLPNGNRLTVYSSKIKSVPVSKALPALRLNTKTANAVSAKARKVTYHCWSASDYWYANALAGKQWTWTVTPQWCTANRKMYSFSWPNVTVWMSTYARTLGEWKYFGSTQSKSHDTPYIWSGYVQGHFAQCIIKGIGCGDNTYPDFKVRVGYDYIQWTT